jgi:hypothetical protein
MSMEPPTDTNHSEVDPTYDVKWQLAHTDRLLGFEFLNMVVRARYQEMKPEVLADKIGVHKGIAYSITESIKAKLHADE